MLRKLLIDPLTYLALPAFFPQQVHSQSTDYGTFLFPATSSTGSYNSLDTLNASWTTKSNSFTDPYLMLWVGSYPQTLVYNQSMSTKTSTLVPLDFGNAYPNSNFVLQQSGILNVGAPFYISGSFIIRNERSLQPTTYGLDHSAPLTTTLATSTASATLTTTPPPNDATATSTSTSPPPISPAQTPSTNSALIGGLTALAILLVALTTGISIWFWRRKRVRAQRGRVQRGWTIRAPGKRDREDARRPWNLGAHASLEERYSHAPLEAPDTSGLNGLSSKRLLGFFGSEWRPRGGGKGRRWNGGVSELSAEKGEREERRERHERYERHELPVEEKGKGELDGVVRVGKGREEGK